MWKFKVYIFFSILYCILSHLATCKFKRLFLINSCSFTLISKAYCNTFLSRKTDCSLNALATSIQVIGRLPFIKKPHGIGLIHWTGNQSARFVLWAIAQLVPGVGCDMLAFSALVTTLPSSGTVHLSWVMFSCVFNLKNILAKIVDSSWNLTRKTEEWSYTFGNKRYF